MLTQEQIKHIQDDFNTPVDSCYPGTYWIISLDKESRMPTDDELRQLQSYREYMVRRIYNETYTRTILAQKLPKCPGHNTTIFRKGSWRTPEWHWFYRKKTWQHGPTFAPDIMIRRYKGLTLVELLDQRIHTIYAEEWAQWKKEHGSVFPTT
jgi:hypothetical protein